VQFLDGDEFDCGAHALSTVFDWDIEAPQVKFLRALQEASVIFRWYQWIAPQSPRCLALLYDALQGHELLIDEASDQVSEHSQFVY
jgi:hypothetical protein